MLSPRFLQGQAMKVVGLGRCRGWVARAKDFAALRAFPGAAPLPQLLTEDFCLGMLAPRLPVGLPPESSPIRET